MRALVVDRTAPRHLRLGEAPEPVVAPHQALVRVTAASLNFGEVSTVSRLPDATVPGWDAAGFVERPAADGSGPVAGTAVVTLDAAGGWAELRAVDTASLGVAPEGADHGALSTVPVAATSALRALREVGFLLGRRILVTGATGGVGRYAVQLARMGGAHVTACTGEPRTYGAELRGLGAHEVVSEPGELDYLVDGVVDCVGGPQLVTAFDRLNTGGTLVAVGHVTGRPEHFPLDAFLVDDGRHGRSITTFHLQNGVAPAGDLGWLAGRVASGDLDPGISWRGSWDRADEAVAALLERRLRGKAVLELTAG
ncbi:zinc-binding dehydrogenase [Nocardiopsis sp. CNS-639]|uniref:zinc-binding dehydrogenase n=1 Tax=Nocardiopsis sp. CNS-639 TaxID=1169153 RepID=UPI000373CD0A|nr:zinc-binding dehydrogenase [Nocardiopsis sp. CNS-639]